MTRYEADKIHHAEVGKLCDQVAVLEDQLRRQQEEHALAHKEL